MRILIAEFKQETNSFIPGYASLEDFKVYNLLYGEEILSYFKGNENEIGAFIKVLSQRKDVTIVPSIAANGHAGPTVEQEVFDHVQKRLLDDVKNSGELDGILIAFHGAMALDGIEDPEGELLSEIRAVVGKKIPICITLDFHANITERMAENSTLMFPYRRYPHTDMFERGILAAESLLGILDGRLSPCMVSRKLPVLCPMLSTDELPFSLFLDKTTEIEDRDDVISASISAGFPYADIYEGGMCITVQTNGDVKLAEKLTEELTEIVWSSRDKLEGHYFSPEEAVSLAMSEKSISVLADVADNPGAGSASDSTEIIHELLRKKAKNVIVATICDPKTVKHAIDTGVGNTFNASLGGKSDPRVGTPIVASAYVKCINDGVFTNRDTMAQGVTNHLGATAVLVIEGITIVVTSERYQPWDSGVFWANGIDPTRASIIVLKSSVHYRHAFGKFATNMYSVDAKNVWQLDLQKLGIKNCRRPVHPLN